jgi:hypothetical protein
MSRNNHTKGAVNETDEQQPKIVVDDPADFAKTRQLRSIFDAVDDYIQARRDAKRAREDNEIDFETMHGRIFRYAQDLAMTMEPLLKSSEEGRSIWTQRTYQLSGAVRKSELLGFEKAYHRCQRLAEDGDADAADAVESWEKLEDSGFSHRKDEVKNQVRTVATDWGWSVEGAESLVKRTPKLVYPQSTSRGVKFEYAPPADVISDRLFRDLQDHLRQMGLGVSFDTEQQTKIDDDLLEEVDEWRQEKVK